MAQYFYINSNSINPTLRVELVNDAKYDWFKSTSFNEAIQNATITFTMWDENDILKISKEPCNLILSEDSGCETKYIIEYAWKERDTRRKGVFTGRFEITFLDDLRKPSSETTVITNNKIDTINTDYPRGKFIVPIYEDLKIEIK